MREEAKRAAREARSEALEVKAADRQLKNEAKLVYKPKGRSRARTAVELACSKAHNINTEAAGLVTARSQRGRQIKPPQRFDI